MILTRAEKRQAERAKEKHVKRLVAGGWNEFKDITEQARNSPAWSAFTGDKPIQVFQNNLFIVQVFEVFTAWGWLKKAMIRRSDARPEHDWAVIQRIKSEVFGPEVTALEVYPRESRKVDVANLYWIWILPNEFDCPIEVRKS